MTGNNLQELTQKIYEEGVEKARKEGEHILQEVKEEARQIIARAEEQAQQIIEKAEQKVREIRQQNEAELKLSARQAISALKQKIVDLIVARVAAAPLEKAFDDQKFIQEIIEKLIFAWLENDKQSDDLRVLLPEGKYQELEKYFAAKENELLQKGVQIQFQGKMKDGFVIGPQDGSYKISFTSEDFENYFKAYLRPRTYQRLFGEEE
ncbi:MAG: V-type ATP synthase subunit E [Bacteroidetes bacterium]|nr:MAG: V-type ATP synthase subunit E [Bacteroidota bacterium]